MTGFTDFDHPVLAVHCPDCGAGPGAKCSGLTSGLTTGDFHLSRKQLAGQVFVERHGHDAELSKVDGSWVVQAVPAQVGSAAPRAAH